MAQKKPEEENVGYQRRIKIKLPGDVKIGFDPFENPATLLPIDDSFRQIPYPVDKNGHIMLSGGDPNFVDGIATVPAEKPEDVKNKEYQPLPVDIPPPTPAGTTNNKTNKIEAVTNAPEQPETPEAPNKVDLPTVSMDESGQEDLEEKVVQKDVGEDGITEQDYHHGLLPREDVDKLLSKPGDFLLRVTELNAGDTGTSCITTRPVAAGGQIQTFILKKEKGKLFLTEPVGFDSIVDLVNHYMKTKKIFGRPSCQLLRPICRQEWEFYQDQVKCIKPIGNGAYGQVYYGKLTLKSSPKPVDVAVKQMKLSMMNRDKIEDIMREARLMRMMIHDNIVRCLGVCADQEPLMIVIEYVAGGALDAYLRTNGPRISIYERVSMCLDAARGLSHVHKMGIIHRDVAARNCLYTRNCLKISDFGLSRQAAIYKADPAERCPIKYLAPEVFISHTYTCQSDVWAYGVLMYEIFSNGAEPYARKTPPQVKQIVLTQGSLLGPPSWAPDYVKTIMSECFVKHPSIRAKFGNIVKTFVAVRAAEQKHADVMLAMKMARKKGKPTNKPIAPKAKPGPSNSQRKVKKKKEKDMNRTQETREEGDVSSKKLKQVKDKRPSKNKKARKTKPKHH